MDNTLDHYYKVEYTFGKGNLGNESHVCFTEDEVTAFVKQKQAIGNTILAITRVKVPTVESSPKEIKS